MTQLEILEQQIVQLDNDSFSKLSAWFAELEQTRREDAYWGQQAEIALKTGFAGTEQTLNRLQQRFNVGT